MPTLRERAGALVVPAQVFVGGAAVMAIELAGSRLLAPHFGSTLYVWGSLIGVVMTALAIGAFAGGRVADRWPTRAALSAALATAGVLAAAIAFAAPRVLPATAPLGVTWGPLVATAVLLAPSAALLGMATPFAVRLAAPSPDASGSAAGRVYALSTAGSIAGTFATAFVLVPAMRVSMLLLLVGASLAAVAVLGMRTPLRSGLALAIALTLVSPVAQTALDRAGLFAVSNVAGGVVHAAETPYHSIQVVESRDGLGGGRVRALVMDGLRHSTMYVERPNETPSRYVEFFHLARAFAPNFTSALFVGGGGFSGPKQFLEAYPNATVDVVEIDAEVVRVAERWFAAPVDDPRVRVFTEDARRHLATADRDYDVIVLDAYSRNYIPFHLMTAEFFAELEARLAPGGVVVSNVIAAVDGPASDVLKAEVRTMQTSFAGTYVFPVRGGDWPLAQNVIVVATTGGPALAREDVLEAARRANVTGRDVVASAERLLDGLDLGDAPVLTDDYAPVETLLNPVTREPFSRDDPG